MNTWFQHHQCHLYTWKSPGDRVRNQIDYITMNKRFRNAITQVKGYPRADCGSGSFPSELNKSIFITLPKVNGTIKCEKHRTISLMSHVTKLVLRTDINRIRGRTLDEIAPVQYGLMPDKGTGNAMFVLRRLVERSVEKQRDDHIKEYQLDIVALTETWLSSEDSKNKHVIDQCVAHGYTLHHSPRTSGRRGGWV